ncbi:MAG: tRNA-dihydrouridine synthase [Gammaproteobacteria bacterium]
MRNAVDIPVIANGDIDTPEKARSIIEYTGADGLMIGRAAQGRPWVFKEMNAFLENGTRIAAPTSSKVRAIMLAHLENLYAFYGENKGVRIARKHIGWYCRRNPGSEYYRKQVVRVGTAKEQLTLTKNYFDRLAFWEVAA